jgi:hypothetical protein
MAGAAFLLLSAKSDIKREAREKEEALRLEGEIKREALALCASEEEDEEEEDFCPHKRVCDSYSACDSLVACDLTDKIYRAAWADGIAPHTFLHCMSMEDDADLSEEYARKRIVYLNERRRRHSQLEGCTYKIPRK